MKMFYRSLAMTLLLVGAAAATELTDAELATIVVDEADLTYRTTFDLPCSLSTWQALVEDPVLFADLWNAYGFGPAYQVSLHGEKIRVFDPTGLVGDVSMLRADPGHRRYLVRGRLDHWAVPFLNDGLAVFELETRSTETGMAGGLVVHIQAGNSDTLVLLERVAGFVVDHLRPALLSHMANRIELNLRDAGLMLVAIEEIERRNGWRPDTVRGRVGEDLVARLLRTLVRTSQAERGHQGF
ncbi:MAG: hypothetical protein HOH43_17815 [Candidatus Latescibacteria bacterium]|jgi:hypothetical protein|nr:hypothetical protein [Candidatus Latescibacterota bacterium]